MNSHLLLRLPDQLDQPVHWLLWSQGKQAAAEPVQWTVQADSKRSTLSCSSHAGANRPLRVPWRIMVTTASPER